MQAKDQSKQSHRTARITVLADGPYQLIGAINVAGVDGSIPTEASTTFLCRCGGSRNKPFCDATHGLKGFIGAESADKGPIVKRHTAYRATDGGITVFDDRSRCSHAGQCSKRLPQTFRAGSDPFVDPDSASIAEISSVVDDCPSGALTYRLSGVRKAPEATSEASIVALQDGPYLVRGNIELISAAGDQYEHLASQTLCRCGLSRNRPFCDGSHWYAGFRDPLPPELVKQAPTLFDWLGGMPVLEKLTDRFYDKILSEPDPVLEPIFRKMDPDHPGHVARWLAETFGGPPSYTDKHGGYQHMLAKHKNLGLTEIQRQRWVSRMAQTADDVGLPDDPDFRSAFIAYLEWGTRIALLNSDPDAEPIKDAPVPRWGWGNTPPLALQAWDDPQAAEKGREHCAAQTTSFSGYPGATRLPK